MIFKNKHPKIFCIGQNKTGTTSLEKFFIDHGYKLGDQKKAGLLLDDCINRNWKPIIDYCKTAEVFQDIPFSNEYLYVLLDHYFPNAKFILSIRTNSEEWYNSVTKFHAKLFGKDGNFATKEDLENGNFIYKGFVWKAFKEKYGEIEDDIYNKENLINKYEQRNTNIMNYFKNKDNFITIDLAQKETITQLSTFLKVTPKYHTFPWKNKTSEI